MWKKGQFEVLIGSDPDHNDLVGEILFEGKLICIVTQEKGIEALEISFSPKSDGENLEFSLSDFEDALAYLKNRLWDLRKSQS